MDLCIILRRLLLALGYQATQMRLYKIRQKGFCHVALIENILNCVLNALLYDFLKHLALQNDAILLAINLVF